MVQYFHETVTYTVERRKIESLIFSFRGIIFIHITRKIENRGFGQQAAAAAAAAEKLIISTLGFSFVYVFFS